MANPQKEDGYTPIANDLLEALIRWDGPGRVKDLALAIMRETYGWSSKRRPVKAHRLCALLDVSERRVRQLREVALACNLIVADGDGYELQKDFDLWTSPKPRGMSENAQRVLRRGYSAEGTPHDALPGAEGTPQDVLGEPPSGKAEGGSAPPLNNPLIGRKQESKNDSTPPPPSPAVNGRDGTATMLRMLDDETPSEPLPEPSEKPRSDTPEQAAIHEAWNAYGLEGVPTEDGPKGKKYGRLMAALQTAGIPKAQAWSAYLRETSGGGCPEGAKPMANFCEAFVSAMKPNAPWTWKRDGGRPRLPTGEFIRRNDGSIELRKDWSFGDELTVNKLKEENNWNPRTGRPIRQTVGFKYSDENPHPEDV